MGIATIGGFCRRRQHPHDHHTRTVGGLQGRINVAFDEHELIEKLDRLSELRVAERISSTADPRLIATIAAFVRGERLVVDANGHIHPAGTTINPTQLASDALKDAGAPSRNPGAPAGSSDLQVPA